MGSPGSLIRNLDSGWMGGTSTCIGESQYPYWRSPWSLVGQKGIFSMEPCRTKYVLFSFQSLLSEPSIGTEPRIVLPRLRLMPVGAGNQLQCKPRE